MQSLSRRLLLLGCLSAMVWSAHGQETIVSTIRGVVTDSSGLAVPGATATVQNQRTGLVRSAATSDIGEFVFDNLTPAHYTLKVEFSGFKRYEQKNIDLTASKTIRVNVALEVGEVTESVTVSAASSVLETESASVSHSARNAVMNEVPTAGSIQGGRLIHTYLHLVPGNASGGGFNGLPRSRVTLDGIAVNAGCCQIEPTLEMVDELKVITHNAPAEYSIPATVQLTTRQGGNSFHGDFWWLYIDKSLEARDPFFAEKVVQHGHTFAWSIGGPIIKDKMFFYHGFEEQRFNNFSVSDFTIQANSLPTARMQQGDFSELIDPGFVNPYNNGRTVVVTDPLTGQALPNNIIPRDRISSVSTNLIQRFYLNPDRPGLVANQFSNALRPRRRYKPDIRVDYIFSPRHSFFARYGHTGLEVNIPTTNIRPEHTNDIDRVFPSRSANVSDILTFGPHVTNELKIGFVRTRLALANVMDTEDTMATAGMVNTQGITGLLGLTFSGTGNFTGIPARAFSNSVTENWGFSDHVSIYRGKHNIKTGFQFNRSHSFNASANTPPTFTFNGRLSGWTWSDFMLGYPATISRSLASPANCRFQNEFGMFVQDEIQVNRSLTLNVGLRYQVWPFSFEKYDKLAVFDATTQSVIVPSEQSKQFVVPNFPAGQLPIRTAAEAGYAATNRSLTNTDFNDIAPRFGFAWRAFGRTDTVIRGGYGLFYYNNSAGGSTSGGSIFSGSQTLTQQLGSNGTLTPIMAFPDPFRPFLTGPVQALSAQTIGLTAGDPNLDTPTVHEWSLTLERGMRDWVFRASYLGSAEKHNQYTTNINEAPPGKLPFAQERRPVPAVRDINYTQNGGSATSNALQVVVDKRFAQGFSFNAAYTWLHKLTNFEFFGPGAAFGRDRFRSNPSFATPRQQLILTYNWEVPVGRGRRYGNNLHPVLDGIAGGWRIVGVGKFETGQYLSPQYVGVNPAGTTPGTGSLLPDRIADGNLDRGVRGSNAPDRPFFDLAAFACPGGSDIGGRANLLSQGCPLSTPENVGRFGNSSPAIVEGPGINTWNMSVAKRFLPREGMTLELAAWISNPWNHTSWSDPSMNLSSPASAGLITSTRVAGFIEPFSLGRRRISLQAKIVF